MSVEEIKALVMRFVDEPWNKGNVDSIDELCDPEYTVRYAPDNWVGGREDIKKAALDARMKSTDFMATVTEIIVEGDRVAYEWIMAGTEDGKYKKTFGITILRLKNGKIIEDRFIADDVRAGETVA